MISDLLNLNEENIRSLSPAEKEAVLRILREISEKGKSETYVKILERDYDEVPVSIDKFIADDHYIGGTTQNGKNIYPYWRAKLREVFSPKNNYQEIIFTGAIGVGKTTIAITGMAYCLYCLMCLKEPQLYYGLQANSKIVFAFFNINLDLSFDVAYKKLQSMLIESPWFLKNGTLVGREDRTKQYVPNKGIVFRVGSQPEHGLGQDIFCVTGDTEIMTDLGYEKIENLEGKPIYAVTYDVRTGMLCMSNMTTVKKSGYTNNICVISLENGTCVKCTPDHKFMLSNGEYRMAKDLSPNDDIMSI